VRVLVSIFAEFEPYEDFVLEENKRYCIPQIPTPFVPLNLPNGSMALNPDVATALVAVCLHSNRLALKHYHASPGLFSFAQGEAKCSGQGCYT
jgi:hypothetical protein